MNRIARGIGFIGEVYGMPPERKLIVALGALGPEVREVRFELTRDGVPLLVYSLVPGVFTGQVPVIVPIRETHGKEKFGYEVSALRDKGAICPHGWRSENTFETRPVLEAPGFSVWADPILRSRGVVSSLYPEKGLGFIRLSESMLFLDRWVERGPLKLGAEVEFLPIAEPMKGLQARAVRAL